MDGDNYLSNSSNGSSKSSGKGKQRLNPPLQIMKIRLSRELPNKLMRVIAEFPYLRSNFRKVSKKSELQILLHCSDLVIIFSYSKKSYLPTPT